MMTISIPELFNQIEQVPRIPEVVRKLMTQIDDPNIDFAVIAENIEKEQLLSLKVLRLVNSAHYGLPQKVGAIKQALVILGMKELRQIVITSAFITSTPTVPGLDIDDFWIDNFRTACYAKWLADHTRQDNSDMIFTAGLINSFGLILLHLGAPDIAKTIAIDVKRGKNRRDTELKYLGFTNQQICAELGREWQFSDELIATILQSAAPLEHDDVSVPACTVAVARYISESSFGDNTQEEILAGFPRQEWQHLGLHLDDIEDIMAQLLELDTGIDGLLD